MSSPVMYSTEFPSLAASDTVADATRQMLDHRVNDLPVVDGEGRFLGMFKLNHLLETLLPHLLETLLPRAAVLDYGMPDLAFVGDTLEQVKERMRAIAASPVRDFVVKPEHVVHPQTSPLEMVLLLYRGANTVPVVSADGRTLVGMVSARDALRTLHDAGVA